MRSGRHESVTQSVLLGVVTSGGSGGGQMGRKEVGSGATPEAFNSLSEAQEHLKKMMRLSSSSAATPKINNNNNNNRGPGVQRDSADGSTSVVLNSLPDARKFLKSSKKTLSERQQQRMEHDEEKVTEPRTFIFRRGPASKRLQQLIGDLRVVMMPHTANNLKERRTNKLRDFIGAAGPLGVTHLMVLTESASGAHLRILKVPQGPTFTFKLVQYNLIKEVISNQNRKPAWKHTLSLPSVVVLRGLNCSLTHHKLTSTLLQGLFASLNMATVTARSLRRLTIVRYNETDDSFHIRHYISKILNNREDQPFRGEPSIDNGSYSACVDVQDKRVQVW
eukprot:CAMPEP_0184484292 /NCGR_PEP_ID=MMETSP0113_2-20130426/6018_1 /TAXON_ID=91329 /ORGANISM="Norrisiella sphaerica, Strain BC52" /LENGTH=334 /DNA_ID=CAMNT_0026865227 /DNA_START=28 /DNA_END=1029 /DNA_ORIENTATION=+